MGLELTSDTLVSVCAEGWMRLWDIHTMVRIGKRDAVGLQVETTASLRVLMFWMSLNRR